VTSRVVEVAAFLIADARVAFARVVATEDEAGVLFLIMEGVFFVDFLQVAAGVSEGAERRGEGAAVIRGGAASV